MKKSQVEEMLQTELNAIDIRMRDWSAKRDQTQLLLSRIQEAKKEKDNG